MAGGSPARNWNAKAIGMDSVCVSVSLYNFGVATVPFQTCALNSVNRYTLGNGAAAVAAAVAAVMAVAPSQVHQAATCLWPLHSWQVFSRGQEAILWSTRSLNPAQTRWCRAYMQPASGRYGMFCAFPAFQRKGMGPHGGAAILGASQARMSPGSFAVFWDGCRLQTPVA